MTCQEKGELLETRMTDGLASQSLSLNGNASIPHLPRSHAREFAGLEASVSEECPVARCLRARGVLTYSGCNGSI